MCLPLISPPPPAIYIQIGFQPLLPSNSCTTPLPPPQPSSTPAVPSADQARLPGKTWLGANHIRCFGATRHTHLAAAEWVLLGEQLWESAVGDLVKA